MSCPSDIKRFFVTPEQSGQICLLATFLGDTGNIFFPKLDFHKDQIYFKEIALDFLKENGFEPELVNQKKKLKNLILISILQSIQFIFLKQILQEKKHMKSSLLKKKIMILIIMILLGFINTPDIKISFEDVESDFETVFNNPNSQKSDIVTIIKKYVPDFMHIETGKHLDQKM